MVDGLSLAETTALVLRLLDVADELNGEVGRLHTAGVDVSGLIPPLGGLMDVLNQVDEIVEAALSCND